MEQMEELGSRLAGHSVGASIVMLAVGGGADGIGVAGLVAGAEAERLPASCIEATAEAACRCC